MNRSIFNIFALLVLLPALLSAQELDLTELSLEELLQIEVALVSRTPEQLADVPAAIYALTAEDLRRAGVHSLPAALRLVPGMQVARVDANKWAITARGFNNLFANKLLVLIDGRSVYSPIFSGVFWEAQDVVMADVERIEVIRGPGGTLWGANAVNGIINVVTRSARDSQGTLVQAGGGTRQSAWTTARHSGLLGETGAFRVYARQVFWPAQVDSAGRRTQDDWRVSRAGGRLDLSLSARDELTIQGGLYAGQIGQTYQLITSLEPPYTRTFSPEESTCGAHLLGRWQRQFDDRSAVDLQFYYDRGERHDGPLDGSIDVFDLDFQCRRRFSRHELVWGMGFRRSADSFTGSFTFSFQPPRRTTHLWSAFAHDILELTPDLRLSLGSKFEHNTHTGLEIQPGSRLRWNPSSRQTLWLSLTRAVRTPSRSDDDMRFAAQVIDDDELFPGSPLALAVSRGDRSVVAERLLAWEAGYRLQPDEAFALDLATFLHLYDDLRTTELGLPEPADTGTHLIVPLAAANLARGRTYGFELAADWQPLSRWQVRASYAFLQMDLSLDKDSQDDLSLSQEEENPHHQFVLRAHAELSRQLDLDLTGRYMGALPAQRIPAYLTLDLRLGWRPTNALELALTGRDLFDSPRPEFAPQVVASLPTWIERELYGEISYRF